MSNDTVGHTADRTAPLHQCRRLALRVGRQALALAKQLSGVLAAANKKPVYVDCNAVSPDSMLDIADAVSQRIIDLFDAIAPSFYSAEDRAAGYIIGKDRQGNEVKAGLMSISIGIVSNTLQKINHVAQIGEIGAELKKFAKAQDKSNFIRDKRMR